MKTITIRNVPASLHRECKRRAAAAGVSLSEYLQGELRRLASTPSLVRDRPNRQLSMQAWLRRLHSRRPVTLKTPAAEIIREMRGPIG